LFTLPHFRAKPEFHLSEVADSVKGHLIQLDPEFCNRPVFLHFDPLRIDSSEKEMVRELLVNLQLNERFLEKLDSEKPEAKVSAAFYGSATSVTKMGDYIELSDLRECIEEIIPQVSIQSNNTGEFLTIIGLSCLDIYPPLVLIDNIPVPNNDVLLHIPSSRIKSIEVLNEAYMIGEFRYSGIINIFSNQHDMAGISLEGEHSFFNFQPLFGIGPIPLHWRSHSTNTLEMIFCACKFPSNCTARGYAFITLTSAFSSIRTVSNIPRTKSRGSKPVTVMGTRYFFAIGRYSDKPITAQT